MSGKVIVEADGGSRGNPGPAGYGAVVRDPATGEVLAERSGGLGNATNNVAEYEGMMAGLRAALELGAEEVLVRLDSKLVVEQMSGRWRVKHENLKPLFAEAGGLVRRFDSVRFEWIARERNKHADRLANEAMDEQAGLSGRAGDGQPAGTSVSEPVPRAAVSESPSAGTSSEPPRPWTGAVGAATRLLVLRHGQTALSVDRRYSGRGDVPLTELGGQQAKAAAGRLAAAGPVPVISSPLARTRQTAEAVVEATGGPLSFHDGLQETDFGAWEGLSFTEASRQYAKLHSRWLGDPTVQPPDGESMQAVYERVGEAARELLREHAGRTVVVVTHVTPIKVLLRLGLDVGPSLFYRLHLDLASLSVVEFYPDGNSSVRLVNDTSHLGAASAGLRPHGDVF